jgi:hypothetical protein
MFEAPVSPPYGFCRDMLAVHDALNKRRDQAENRDKRNFDEIALRPRLVKLQPSQHQATDTDHGALHGALPTLRHPQLRGRGIGPIRLGQTMARFTHDIIFQDQQMRDDAATALNNGDTVWAMVVPRLRHNGMWVPKPVGVAPKTPPVARLNYHYVVIPTMVQVGDINPDLKRHLTTAAAQLARPAVTDPRQQAFAL